MDTELKEEDYTRLCEFHRYGRKEEVKKVFEHKIDNISLDTYLLHYNVSRTKFTSQYLKTYEVEDNFKEHLINLRCNDNANYFLRRKSHKLFFKKKCKYDQSPLYTNWERKPYEHLLLCLDLSIESGDRLNCLVKWYGCSNECMKLAIESTKEVVSSSELTSQHEKYKYAINVFNIALCLIRYRNLATTKDVISKIKILEESQSLFSRSQSSYQIAIDNHHISSESLFSSREHNLKLKVYHVLHGINSRESFSSFEKLSTQCALANFGEHVKRNHQTALDHCNFLSNFLSLIDVLRDGINWVFNQNLQKSSKTSRDIQECIDGATKTLSK